MSAPGLEPPQVEGVSPLESILQQGAGRTLLLPPDSETWSAWQGPVGREHSSRCWPLMQAAKQMQMGLFQSPNLLATRHRSKEKADLFLSILGLKLTPLSFLLPRLP